MKSLNTPSTLFLALATMLLFVACNRRGQVPSSHPPVQAAPPSLPDGSGFPPAPTVQADPRLPLPLSDTEEIANGFVAAIRAGHMPSGDRYAGRLDVCGGELMKSWPSFSDRQRRLCIQWLLDIAYPADESARPSTFPSHLAVWFMSWAVDHECQRLESASGRAEVEDARDAIAELVERVLDDCDEKDVKVWSDHFGDILKTYHGLPHFPMLCGLVGTPVGKEQMEKAIKDGVPLDPTEVELGTAKLGDVVVRDRFIAKFKDATGQTKAMAARHLGYIGDAACGKALSEGIRTSESYESGIVRYSVRVDIIAALSRMHPREACFQPNRSYNHCEEQDQPYYDKVEAKLVELYGVSWDHPRPPLSYADVTVPPHQSAPPLPAKPSAGDSP